MEEDGFREGSLAPLLALEGLEIRYQPVIFLLEDLEPLHAL